MPIYEYRCAKCTKTFEVFQKMSDAPPAKCELCGSKKVSRLVSQTTFQLKGDGWYASGYAKSAVKDTGKDGDAGATKTEAKADGKTETKTEAKADKKADAKTEKKTSGSGKPGSSKSAAN